MSLLAQSALFQKLAQDDDWKKNEERAFQEFQKRKAMTKDLVRQGLVDQAAWEVLKDHLLDTGEIKDDDDGLVLSYAMRFYGGLKRRYGKDIKVGDMLPYKGPSLYSVVIFTQWADYWDGMDVETITGSEVIGGTDTVLVREPPEDWDRKAFVSRIEKWTGIK